MSYDVVIAGGGPAGLAAALMLGRARKRVLLCDAGTPRNAAAVHVHGFVTRDGITPAEFRRIGRQQLEAYPAVEARDVRVEEIAGERDAFDVRLTTGRVEARRILLCTGMIDEVPEIDGFRALWGASIFQCPYCHGWEIQNQRFGYLATKVEALEFPLLLRAWTSEVTALTDGKFAVPPEAGARLTAGGVRIEQRPIARLVPNGGHLERIEFADGQSLPCDALFAHPRQRQGDLVRSLGLVLDETGYVQIDAVQRETSVPGIYAAGDLASAVQGALVAAASGVQAATRLNHALTVDLAITGALA
ncbi:MAG: NAD(P)/FAD-dependent oxidoreductase [Vicinamibacterales bacterium]